MKFDELYEEIVESTSKAPKGDSYDSQNNWKPSGVDSDSDGSGGRYRRTRPNKPGRSKATHGGRGVEDAEGQSLADDSSFEEDAWTSLADDFMEFASLLSAAEQGQGVDIDRLRIELNALDERLEALKSEESEETFDQLYDRYVTTNQEDAEEDAERVDKDRMKCNSPRRTSGGSKKFVVKACKDGKEKVVRFGDPNMKIKKSNPKRRKSFRARHKCDQKKDKFSAGYWSCKKW